MHLSGVLWSNLIHQSWKSLEFGDYKPPDEMINKFLSTSKTEEREELVKEIMQDHPEVFSKDRIAMRIGQGLIMCVLIFAKTLIYVLLGVLQIVLQVIAIVFVLFAPIVLFLALIPSYGFDVLGLWAKKIFETQLAVLLITFLMGSMIMISNLINSISNNVGWLVGLLLEVILGIGLFYYRSQVFSMFVTAGQMGRVVSHPAMLKHAMKYGIDPFQFPYPGYGGDVPFPMGNRRRSPRYYEDDYGYGPEEEEDSEPDGAEPTSSPRQITTRPDEEVKKGDAYNQEGGNDNQEYINADNETAGVIDQSKDENFALLPVSGAQVRPNAGIPAPDFIDMWTFIPPHILIGGEL